jgi:hypothetical protein
MSTLFLEAYSTASVKPVKLEDLLESMLDFQLELNTFNESLLVADYQLSLQEGNDEAKAGFFKRAVDFIAGLWKALKNKISQIIAWVAARAGLNYVNSHSLTAGRLRRVQMFNKFLSALNIKNLTEHSLDGLKTTLDRIKSMDLGGEKVDGAQFGPLLKSIASNMKRIENEADEFYKNFENSYKTGGARNGSVLINGAQVTIAEVKKFLSFLNSVSVAVTSISKVTPASEETGATSGASASAPAASAPVETGKGLAVAK